VRARFVSALFRCSIIPAILFWFSYGNALACACNGTAKVLLIHAGGFSKRLPNVSVIGKIFAALPLGNPV
jgi:hypothetical protein